MRSAAVAVMAAAITASVLAGQAAPASAAAGPGAAGRPDGGPGHWTQVTGQISHGNEIGLVRGADGVLHVIWQAGITGARIMDTPIAPDGAVGSQTTIATGQAGASNPDATVTPSGLDTFWLGPTNLMEATRSARGGHWGVEKLISDVSIDGVLAVSAATGGDGRPWISLGGLDLLHLGHSVDNVRSACCIYNQGLATDGVTGTSYLAYQALITGANGTWVRRLSQTGVTGRPSRLAGSEVGGNTLIGEQRVAITGRGRGRAGVYVSYRAGYPSAGSLRVYRIGASKPVTLATVNPISAGIFGTAITAGPDGRLWDAWIVKTNPDWELFVRASNPAVTAWSPTARVALPKGTEFIDAVYESAQAGKVDLIALLQLNNGRIAYYATQVPFPRQIGASPAAPGPR